MANRGKPKSERNYPPGIQSYLLRRRVFELCREQGWTQKKAGEELGISQARVCQILKDADQQFFYDNPDVVDAWWQKVLETHAWVIEQSQRAYVESIGKVEVKTEGIEKGQPTELTTTSYSPGDAQHLRAMQASLKAIEDRFGFKAPTKHAVVSMNVNAAELVKGFTPEMLEEAKQLGGDDNAVIEVALKYAKFGSSGGTAQEGQEQNIKYTLVPDSD